MLFFWSNLGKSQEVFVRHLLYAVGKGESTFEDDDI